MKHKTEVQASLRDPLLQDFPLRDLPLRNLPLRNLQRWMRWVLTDPRGVADAIGEPTPAEVKYRNRYISPQPDCLDLIALDPPLSPIERLDIYAEGYFARIAESLGTDFSAIKRVVGEDTFLKIVADYLKAYPSRMTNIGEIGSQLAHFLRDHELGQENEYLSELAVLEWAVIESFYANDLPLLSVSHLNKIPENTWPHARFKLDSSVRLLKTHWPVDRLWTSRAQDNFSEVFDSFAPEESSLLVFRNGRDSQHAGNVLVHRISPQESAALGWIKERASLGQICEQLGQIELIGEWFGQWMSHGILREIDFEEET